MRQESAAHSEEAAASEEAADSRPTAAGGTPASSGETSAKQETTASKDPACQGEECCRTACCASFCHVGNATLAYCAVTGRHAAMLADSIGSASKSPCCCSRRPVGRQRCSFSRPAPSSRCPACSRSQLPQKSSLAPRSMQSSTAAEDAEAPPWLPAAVKRQLFSAAGSDGHIAADVAWQVKASIPWSLSCKCKYSRM